MSSKQYKLIKQRLNVYLILLTVFKELNRTVKMKLAAI